MQAKLLLMDFKTVVPSDILPLDEEDIDHEPAQGKQVASIPQSVASSNHQILSQRLRS